MNKTDDKTDFKTDDKTMKTILNKLSKKDILGLLNEGGVVHMKNKSDMIDQLMIVIRHR